MSIWIVNVVVTLGFIMVCFVTGSTIPPGGKEGRDFFNNKAQGRRQSCAEFCDLPTDYPVSCKDWCYDYKPKNRTVEASSIVPQSQAPAENNQDPPYTHKVDYIPLVVTGVCIIFLVATGLILVKCFSTRLQPFVRRLREIFCEQLSNAHLEEGAQQPSEQAREPFLHQPGPSDICVGQGSQPVASY